MKTKMSFTQKEEDSGIREDVFCNKCGMSCRGYLGNNNGLIETRVHFNCIIKEKVIGGYDSTHIQDGDIYVFSLCENCLKQLIDSFSLSSYFGDYLHPEPYTGHWNELTDDMKWHNIVHQKDNEIIDWFGTCTKDFLEAGLNKLSNTNSDELSERDDDVIKLLKQFLNK